MVLELATVLLGAAVGAVAVLYVAPKGYLGHRKTRSQTVSMETYTPETEQAVEVPAAVQPAVAEPAPSPAPTPAFYETVQPAPAPVTYAAPSTTSFGAPTMAKKPTRTYRRRAAPVRSTSGPKKAPAKTKKH